MYSHQDSEIFTRRETDVIELQNKDTAMCHWRKCTVALWERTGTFSAIRTLVKKMLTTFFNTYANKRFSSWPFVKQAFFPVYWCTFACCITRISFKSQSRPLTILRHIELQKYHQGVSWNKVMTSKTFLFAQVRSVFFCNSMLETHKFVSSYGCEINMILRDFRLPPRGRRELCSSGLLRSG